MADISSYIQEPYSTPSIVRRRLRRAFSSDVLNDEEIVEGILRADDEILSGLTPWPYAAADFEATAKWTSPILVPFRTEGTGLGDEPQPNNPASGRLRAVQVATTAITDDFVVLFTSATAFTVTALFAGAEGSGTTGSNFTTTSGRVTIPSNYWTGSFYAGDRFFFSTLKMWRQVVTLSSKLAAGILLSDLHDGDIPRMSSRAETLLDSAMKSLGRYQKPDDKSGLRLPSYTGRNTRPIEHRYSVSQHGEDDTDYEEYEHVTGGESL